MPRKTRWAIIGGGCGAQSMAGHLALMGYPVRLFDIFPETVDAINQQGGIHLSGVINGFGKLEFATSILGRAIQGAHAVLVIAPASAHAAIAKSCAPHLSPGQVVMLHSHWVCGALEFRELLRKNGCAAEVPIAETNGFLYTCQSAAPAHVEVLEINADLLIATLPAMNSIHATEMLQEPFPQVKAGANVIEASLGNPAVLIHAGAAILDPALIESPFDWFHNLDGITSGKGAFMEDLDEERLALARSFGLELFSIAEWHRQCCASRGDGLLNVFGRNFVFNCMSSSEEHRTRQLLQDIPYGLVPMIELGMIQGLPMERMKVMAKIGQYLLRDDTLLTGGRTLENLGLAGMSSEQLVHFINTGKKLRGETK